MDDYILVDKTSTAVVKV